MFIVEKAGISVTQKLGFIDDPTSQKGKFMLQIPLGRFHWISIYTYVVRQIRERSDLFVDITCLQKVW